MFVGSGLPVCRGELHSHAEPLCRPQVVECVHLCMAMRGVQKPHSTTVTSCMLGDFKTDPRTRNEFLHLVRSACAPPDAPLPSPRTKWTWSVCRRASMSRTAAFLCA
jgi:hypothetical protein